jgi:glycosylphosphatidylinositol transamidase (GPIT) subunit GPI8
MYSNYLALSDSCGAATLFEFTNSPRFVSVGSSAEGEKSMSHGHDQRYNSAKSDDFTFYLNELFSEGLADWTVGKLHSYMDFQKLRVHSVLKSNYRGKQG